MPANEKFLAWHLRFDVKEAAPPGAADPPAAPAPRWPSEFPVKFGVLFLVQEQGDQETPNPHYHAACVLSSPESKQTLQNRFKKMFPTHCGGDYALMQWKLYQHADDNLLQYMAKGPSKTVPEQPVVLINNTLHDPVNLFNAYWAKNTVMKAETANPDLKKPAHEIIIGRCARMDTYADQQEEVMTKTLAYYRGKVNDHVAFPVIQAVLYHFYPTKTEGDFRTRMLKKFSPY